MFEKIKPAFLVSLTLSIVSTFLTTESFSSELEDKDNSLSLKSGLVATKEVGISYRKLLLENVNHNKKFMTQLDAMPDSEVADDHYLTLIAAVVLPNYKTCKQYAEIANSPNRHERHGEGDEKACMNANNLMIKIVEEVKQEQYGKDTWQYLLGIHFDWK